MDNYTKRLWPSWWLTLALGLFLPAGFIIFLPLDPIVGLVAGLFLWGGSWAVLAIFSPVISATPQGLKAGPAFIGWDNISHLDVITAAESRAAKGVGLDARAWVVVRPWVKPAVRIHLSDVDDPTPYWLVSSTHPEALQAVCQRYLNNN